MVPRHNWKYIIRNKAAFEKTSLPFTVSQERQLTKKVYSEMIYPKCRLQQFSFDSHSMTPRIGSANLSWTF